MSPLARSEPSWGRTAGDTTRPSRATVDDLFDWLAPEYESVVNGFTLGQDLRWKAELLRGVRLRPTDRVLDLASGTGLLQRRVARVVGNERVVGLDTNRSMLTWAPDPERRTVLANAEQLPFAEESFDAITAGYLLKYVDLERFAAEVRRVLRPGGRFGGYDFSKPRRGTLAGTAYAGFLHGVLPRIASSGRTDPGRKAMMNFLGGLAERSGWEERVGRVFEGAGFARRRSRVSLGGAITWFWAERPGR